MYDRILELITESSAARRAATRAKLANVVVPAQKPDPLALRAAVSAQKAKAQRVQKQGQSQPKVNIYGGSRKRATEKGYKLTGTFKGGPGGSRSPRIAPSTAMQAISRGTTPFQKAAPAAQGGTVPSRAKFKLNRVRQQLNREKLAANAPKNADDARNRTDSRVLQNIKASQKARSSSGFAGLASREAGRRRMRQQDSAKTASKQQAPKRATPTTVQPTSSQTGKATKPGAGNIQQALQGGGTTITQVGLKKLAPFLRAGLRTSKVGPVI